MSQRSPPSTYDWLVKRVGQLGTLLAIGLIVAAVFPWREFQSHSHWAKVRWIPFSPPLGFRDIAVNVALFMPLGAAIAFQVDAPLMIRRAHGSASFSPAG